MDREIQHERLPRLLCAVLGATFATIGFLGLAQGGTGGMTNYPATVHGPTVLGLGGSPLLNFAHLLLGVLALLASLKVKSTRAFAVAAIVAFLGLTVYDAVALIARQPGEPLTVRWPVLVVHGVATAVCGLIAGLALRPARGPARAQPVARR